MSSNLTKIAFVISLTFSIFMGAQVVAAKPLDCLPNAKAKARIIYLHGMDISSLSPQEKSIRKTLAQLHSRNEVEIYLPRAPKKCPEHPSQICWMWGAEKADEAIKAQAALMTASKQCFRSKTPLLWFGFSNGGNFLSQLFQACGHQTYLTVGASGGYLQQPPLNLSTCGKYFSAIGKSDTWNYQRGKSFLAALEKSQASVHKLEFDGGHEVQLPVLQKLLKMAGVN